MIQWPAAEGFGASVSYLNTLVGNGASSGGGTRVPVLSNRVTLTPVEVSKKASLATIAS